MKVLSILGVCAGNGASLWPFLNDPKFRVLGNVEPRSNFQTPDNKQWTVNYPEVPFQKTPITGISPDIIIGHPDCGHSSVLTLSRAKKFKDPRDNPSLSLFFDSICKYRPRVWLMENLPGLLDTYTERDIKRRFPEYRFKFLVKSMKAFGNSQVSRKRLVIIAIKRAVGKCKFTLPKLPLSTVEELIGDLVGTRDTKFGQVHEPLEKLVCLWWQGNKLTLKQAQQYWLGPLADSSSWPGHYNAKTQPGVYKLSSSGYPRTVRKQNRQFNYLGLPLTPREMARIQGIPDDFKLVIDTVKLEYWINKSRTTVAKCPPYELFTWFKTNIINNYETLSD